MSSFEMVRGYTPELMGMKQTPVSPQIANGHEEQTARRALAKFAESQQPRIISQDSIMKDDPIYFFRRGGKFGKWEKAYVRSVEPYAILLSTNYSHRGNPIRAALEDVRPKPMNTLLQELDNVGFIFTSLYSILDLLRELVDIPSPVLNVTPSEEDGQETSCETAMALPVKPRKKEFASAEKLSASSTQKKPFGRIRIHRLHC